MSKLEARLAKLNPIYSSILAEAKPLLERGRSVDWAHTCDAVGFLLDFLEELDSEDLNPDILVPAMILHDVGWSAISPALLKESYGEVGSDNKGKILHQEEGEKISRRLLENIQYPKELIDEISAIVSIHDKPEMYSQNRLATVVAEIDRLVRFMPALFWGLIEDGTQTFEQRVEFLKNGAETWFSIRGFKERALELLKERELDPKKLEEVRG